MPANQPRRAPREGSNRSALFGILGALLLLALAFAWDRWNPDGPTQAGADRSTTTSTSTSAGAGSGQTTTRPTTTRPTTTLPGTSQPTTTRRPQDTRPETGRPRARSRVRSLTLIDVEELPAQADPVIDAIESDGPFDYDRDGVTFQNRERILPQESRGYYHEYTVRTPGESDRGARRLVTGVDGSLFYTDDHYESFVQVDMQLDLP